MKKKAKILAIDQFVPARLLLFLNNDHHPDFCNPYFGIFLKNVPDPKKIKTKRKKMKKKAKILPINQFVPAWLLLFLNNDHPDFCNPYFGIFFRKVPDPKK